MNKYIIKNIVYKNVIDMMMKNDSNSSLDTLLYELDNNIDEAIEVLKLIIHRISLEEELDKQEKQFYKTQLKAIEELI
ncbi:hypothetical protein BJV85_002847 [Clostridium acetobutylicum]|uniref:Uncharacterized protein n=1 Tax=Clostridium acetobutylicum (strain ATCC 824 / DSM 792 / JCM 1419 / IAM 19013 / LMG 5710 / NBRC 13948 / NRRL B-527 / VKM B-1787 / 2291 / W) TaxID=272562 RepID=Q97JX1_CLOAB|nr:MULTISPECIES: hypothetical protein [Clostridium]AAK79124.1 Hypothetical protein CA_C1152 [Clostridium acetobutylicum ATCC 824]ADZ20202.1 Conserved hypothetical protein [Clostridium acetobutylicum EA 2018]AEI31660.1 hypothetical protein SMB_G1172 [Clostridium acetobutylicum DSM 1731]AWV81623.1 hypothetical protein DK921_16295 [Clostridium acetobutylicum]MBC2393266.1 hypothetical protein [Clostridium acetobutylicum]